jgi:hypothetical protein
MSKDAMLWGMALAAMRREGESLDDLMLDVEGPAEVVEMVQSRYAEALAEAGRGTTTTSEIIPLLRRSLAPSFKTAGSSSAPPTTRLSVVASLWRCRRPMV